MQRLPTVDDFMDTHILRLHPETAILEAIDFLLRHRVVDAPVVSASGDLVGMLTEKDCLKLLAEGSDAQTARGPVSKFMSTDVETVTPEMDIYYAAGLFLHSESRRFPVVSQGKLIGTISRVDILHAIIAKKTFVR